MPDILPNNKLIPYRTDLHDEDVECYLLERQAADLRAEAAEMRLEIARSAHTRQNSRPRFPFPLSVIAGNLMADTQPVTQLRAVRLRHQAKKIGRSVNNYFLDTCDELYEEALSTISEDGVTD
jgi:hypothetical protein